MSVYTDELSLLNHTKELIHKHYQKDLAEGKLFNVFEILDINTKEVKVCAFITELINPNGTYPFSKIMLEQFMKTVLNIQLEKDELDKIYVYREYKTNTNRRIDIAIESPYRFIPIEVKIYAGDQYMQCRDYYEYSISQKKPFKSMVYYLSLDCHIPSVSSYPELVDNNNILDKKIKCISFENEILNWLNYCVKLDFIKNELYSYALLIQFKNMLERLCGKMSYDLNNSIAELIGKDYETIKAACSISENIAEAKARFMKNLFIAIEKSLYESELKLKPLYNSYDYRQTVDIYYSKRTFPGLSYKLKDLGNNKEQWFRIEIEDRLFCGFVITENGEFNRVWEEWQYLPYGGTNSQNIPNFKNPNESYFKLYDKDVFNTFVDHCSYKAIEILKSRGYTANT